MSLDRGHLFDALALDLMESMGVGIEDADPPEKVWRRMAPALAKMREAFVSVTAGAAAGESRWIRVDDSTPVSTTLIGYDEFYGRIGECFWEPGRRCDYGAPRLVFVDSDDCHITHYRLMPTDPPSPSDGTDGKA